jgi:hypothetical protein
MKRNIGLLILFLFLIISIAIISLKDDCEIQGKKQCENNQQSCPEKLKKVEDVNFMNPLNRFIVAA